nr:arylamine N-acetyltransferase [Oceanobacillus senegalensis]
MEINSLFRKRIGIPENEVITWSKLDYVLEKTAQALPFENLAVIENRRYKISKENLMNKILVNHEGGLCYELNPLFYLFLIENGFDAKLVRGSVYDNENKMFQRLGSTHVSILITLQENTYLIDTGFGANLPLKPVPLTGETVFSKNGEFRIKKTNNEYGDHILEMKLTDKHTDWAKGYAFYSNRPMADTSELAEIQSVIYDNENSPFNKSPLISIFTSNGRILLTNTHYTQWIDSVKQKEKIDKEEFEKLANYFMEK